MVNPNKVDNEYYFEEESYEQEEQLEEEQLEEFQEKIDTIILNIKYELVSYAQNNHLPLCEYLDNGIIENYVYNLIS